ncbi:hypothetical protein HDU93_009645, partial [Gonapodya sp. JEL0774]
MFCVENYMSLGKMELLIISTSGYDLRGEFEPVMISMRDLSYTKPYLLTCRASKELKEDFLCTDKITSAALLSTPGNGKFLGTTDSLMILRLLNAVSGWDLAGDLAGDPERKVDEARTERTVE